MWINTKFRLPPADGTYQAMLLDTKDNTLRVKEVKFKSKFLVSDKCKVLFWKNTPFTTVT